MTFYTVKSINKWLDDNGCASVGIIVGRITIYILAPLVIIGFIVWLIWK